MNTHPLHKALHLLTRPLTLLAVLVVVLSLGNKPIEEKGAWCLYETDDGIAAKVYGTEIADYISKDSGMTWEIYKPGREVDCSPEIKSRYLDVIYGNVYRIRDGMIEHSPYVISYDRTPVYHFEYLTYVEVEYYEKATGNTIANLGEPQSATMDPETSNLIIAVGTKGIIVKDPFNNIHQTFTFENKFLNPNVFQLLTMFENEILTYILISATIINIALLYGSRDKKSLVLTVAAIFLLSIWLFFAYELIPTTLLLYAFMFFDVFLAFFLSVYLFNKMERNLFIAIWGFGITGFIALIFPIFMLLLKINIMPELKNLISIGLFVVTNLAFIFTFNLMRQDLFFDRSTIFQGRGSPPNFNP